MNNHTNTHDSWEPREDATLPDDLRGVHTQLLDAGAAWRDQLPSSASLAERAAQLESGYGRTAAPVRGAFDDSLASSARRSMVPMGRDTGPKRAAAQLRGLIAGAAALLVVGMLGGLLFHFAPGRGIQHSATPTATPPANWSFQAQQNGSSTTDGLPVLAPSEPNVIYETSHPALRRSDDGGVTWHDLPKPGTTFQNVVAIPLFVSPADANTVFLTVEANGPCPGISTTTGFCGATFVSQDGGEHWQQVKLPAPGVLGSTDGLRSLHAAGGSVQPESAQGSRLYSALGPYSSDSGDILGVSSARLVTSTDGGLTWQYADTGLGAPLCDFAASPSGTTLFALTAKGCNSESYLAITLWRSDDAGAHWTRMHDLPSPVASRGFAVSRGTQPPLLYLDLPQLLSAGGTGAMTSNAMSDLKVSADGGDTWIGAPSRGAPSGPDGSGGPSGPLAVLGDGSIIMAWEQAGTARSADSTVTLYAWKYGDPSWRTLLGLGGMNLDYLLVDPSGSALWVVYTTPTGTPNVYQYAVKHIAL